MGLDMYLSLRRSKYVYKDYSTGWEPEYPEEIGQIAGDDQRLGRAITTHVDYEIGYWRKANGIHSWIVQNCGNGVDTCQEIEVEKDKLEELKKICDRIIANPERAEDLLPTQPGFFFGSLEYDDWYMNDVRYTSELLGRLLEYLDNSKGKSEVVIYQASW